MHVIFCNGSYIIIGRYNKLLESRKNCENEVICKVEETGVAKSYEYFNYIPPAIA